MIRLPQDQGDRLLWMLGGAVGVVALISVVLVLWPTAEPGTPPAAAGDATADAMPAPTSTTNQSHVAARLSRARLALDAGMLLAPEGSAAWGLYAEILELEPGNAAAIAGLAAVADAIVDRARLAAREGRDAEADALAARVLERMPNHSGALAVRDRSRVDVSASAPTPTPLRARPIAPARPTVDLTPEPRQEPSIRLAVAGSDRVIELYTRFARALASGKLTSPAEESAEHFVSELRSVDPVHAMTRDAEQQLFEALLAQHENAFDRLDTVAALEWLAAAEALQVDSTRVAAARQVVAEFVAARSANEVVPASELVVTRYVTPSFPSSAQRREIEGWVDVEFMLDRNGAPTDVSAIDSSHSLFEDEALEAVRQWRFEPYRVMGRAVEQRVQTRIRFVFE